MGFLDKVKNMFTEEVEDDRGEVEKIKSEVTHVEIESPSNKRVDLEDTLISNYNFGKEDNKPVFFDDTDFKDLNLIDDEKEEEYDVKKEPEVKLYSNTLRREEEKEEKKIFKPTPIISPVYGILDKNYHKEDIVSRGERPIEKSADISPTIDSIRDKAYGTLEDELEDTLFGSNSILFKKDEPKEKVSVEMNDDILDDLTDDIGKELDELLVKKEKYFDEEKIEESEEKKDNLDDEDILGFIDSTLYNEGDEE